MQYSSALKASEIHALKPYQGATQYTHTHTHTQRDSSGRLLNYWKKHYFKEAVDESVISLEFKLLLQAAYLHIIAEHE